MLDRYQIRSVTDAGCGDFNWQRHVPGLLDRTHYVGVDVVADLITLNRQRHGSTRTRFEHLDITRDPPPRADLVICRDCMAHLTNVQVIAALQQIAASGSDYLLATTYPTEPINRDTHDGQWRPVNLTAPPFCLPVPIEFFDTDYRDNGRNHPGNGLGLWPVECIPALDIPTNHRGGVPMPDTTTDNLTLAEIKDIRQQLTVALAAPDITHGLARAFRSALKELDLYRNHVVSRAQATDTAMGLVRPRIQIGGGSHRIDGFFNIDIVPPADLLWDIRENIPLPDSSVEFLFSEHFLEHIDYPHSVKQYVAEVHRILAAGGQVVTGVPDAEVVLRGYQERDVELFVEMRERWYGRRDCLTDFNTYLDLVNYVFRDQDDDDRYTPHLWAYDYEKLTSLFTEAGLSHVEPWTFDPTIANPERQWASLYVIATK
ncbi:MAG: methyltransferase domain-containing protein [Pseudonocardiaceae bacterium]